MKKLLVILLAFMMVFCLVACGEQDPDPVDTTDTTDTTDPAEGFELALITDSGTINDKSFNQGAWEGLVRYAEENNITYKYYQPTEIADAAYLETIELAVQGGAKVVVCPGFYFEVAVWEAQTLHPDVTFIILDGQPHSAPEGEERDWTIGENVLSIYFAEQESGFLAGYAAVKNGFTKLGFMGGMAVPAVTRFGYGFIVGAETAAAELGIEGVEVLFNYTGTFVADPSIQTLAGSWYSQGTEVIFACGGGIYASICAAAEAADAWVIGVDSDQSEESATIINSAIKLLDPAVYDALASYYAGTFEGGRTITMDASIGATGLAMESNRFENFTQEDYDAIYEKVAAGEIDLPPYRPRRQT